MSASTANPCGAASLVISIRVASNWSSTPNNNNYYIFNGSGWNNNNNNNSNYVRPCLAYRTFACGSTL